MAAKAKFASPLDAIVGLTQSVTKDWTKQRKAEERSANAKSRRSRMTGDRVTIRDAGFQVMQDAYLRASDNGELPVNSRQIFYAARREILEICGRDVLESGYFLQTILRDYMETHDCSSWGIMWDARGHFIEPHTNRIVPVGTLEVTSYLGDRPGLDPASVDQNWLYPTVGPEFRYKTVLFIEKEGFDPLLRASRIGARFDVAIMSTKGMSVSAARLLLDRLVARGVTKMFVLHDFDVSGFSIFGTLGESSKAYRFRNKLPLVDFGLRLADAEEMDLLPEPYHTDKSWGKVSLTLQRHGATPDELRFLGDYKRIELNAMTSAQFISFIERKFAEHGVEKVVPDEETIAGHARRLIEKKLMQEVIAKVAEEIKAQAADVPLPANLRTLIAEKLRASPEFSWDAAVADYVGIIGNDEEE